MTKVLCQFITSTNTPIANAVVEVRLSRSDFDEAISGVIMPRLVEAVADANGEVTLDLVPCASLYHITAYDPLTSMALHYHFYVPTVVNQDDPVRLQDIIVAPDAVLSNVAYDEAALLSILQAKGITLSARDAAVNAAALCVAAGQSMGIVDFFLQRSDLISTTVVYRGEAVIGSSDTDLVWRIRKLTITYGSTVSVLTEYPNGVQTFTHKWSDHLTYNYS